MKAKKIEDFLEQCLKNQDIALPFWLTGTTKAEIAGKVIEGEELERLRAVVDRFRQKKLRNESKGKDLPAWLTGDIDELD